MSMEGMLWALKHAPVADVEERVILGILGEHADPDGCSAWPSQETIAALALVADRTVRRRLDSMEKRGLIARGDQSEIPSRISPDRRPINWDLQIPYSWFTDINQINQMRRGKGRAPLQPSDRPDLKSPPPPKRRADVGAPKKTPAVDIDVDSTAGLEVRPDEPDTTDGLEVRPDSESETDGLLVQSDRTSSPTTLSLTPPSNPTKTPPAFGATADADEYGVEEEIPQRAVQPTLTGEVQAPREPTDQDVAFGIARRHMGDLAASGAPAPDSDLVKLKSGLVKYLKAKYTPEEVYEACRRIGEPVPSSPQMYRTLKAIRAGRPGTGWLPAGRRAAGSLDVNAAWDGVNGYKADKVGTVAAAW